MDPNELMVPIAMLAGSIVLIALVRRLLTSWHQRLREPSEKSAHDLLSGFRKMHQTGELSAEEFKKVKSVLGAKVLAELEIEPAEPIEESLQDEQASCDSESELESDDETPSDEESATDDEAPADEEFEEENRNGV